MSAISRMLVNVLSVLQENPAPATPEDSLLTPKIVLLVDNDPISQARGAQILAEHSCTILRADTPCEAIKLFEDYSLVIDLVIVDVNLPGMSGFELGQRLLQCSPDAPILYASETPAEKVVKEGVFILQKPFDSAELIRSVGTVLDPALQKSPHWAVIL